MLLTPNYCTYCSKYFKNLKKHCKRKTHITKINKDCIENICEFIIMSYYYKYIWIFVMEELTGNIGQQHERELYDEEMRLYAI